MTLDEVREWIRESLLAIHESDPTVQRLRICLAALDEVEACRLRSEEFQHGWPSRDSARAVEKARAALDAALSSGGPASTGSGDSKP